MTYLFISLAVNGFTIVTLFCSSQNIMTRDEEKKIKGKIEININLIGK